MKKSELDLEKHLLINKLRLIEGSKEYQIALLIRDLINERKENEED